jgi:predicted nucleic acid-binding protein
MSRIYWDTMLFIYWLEDHPKFGAQVGRVYSRMQERKDRLITSTFTFGELFAGMYRKVSSNNVDELRAQLRSVVSQLLPFDLDTADRYARIRGELNVRPADAIHLACAAEAGTDLFLTNDKTLVGKFIPGIQFIALLDNQLL